MGIQSHFFVVFNVHHWIDLCEQLGENRVLFSHGSSVFDAQRAKKCDKISYLWPLPSVHHWIDLCEHLSQSTNVNYVLSESIGAVQNQCNLIHVLFIA